MSIYKLMMVAALLAAIAPHMARRDWWSVVMLLVAAVAFFAVPGLSDRAYTPIPANDPFIGGALMLGAGFALCHWCRAFWQIIAAAILAVGVAWSVASMVPGVMGAQAHAIGLEVVFYSLMLVGGMAAFIDVEDFPPPIASAAGRIMQAVARWNGLT